MRIIGNDPKSQNGEVRAVASGALTDGSTVVVNSDGTVGVVEETSITQSVGSPTVFESAGINSTSATFDSSSNRVVIAYRDTGNSNYGTAVVGTVSGTSISFGTPTVFDSVYVTDTSAAFDSNESKVVISYQNLTTLDRGTAVVGTVSSTSISFGSPTVFSTNSVSDTSATFDSNENKVVIAYRDLGNSNFGTAIVGTVSSTSISFGSATVFESANSTDTSATFDSNENKVVIAYRDKGNSSYGTAIVGTVSGSSITFGSATVFESADSDQISATFDFNSNKVVIVYKDRGNSGYGTAIVGIVSGTSISFGSPTVFESASTFFISATFDSNENKVVIAYYDGGNSGYGTSVVFRNASTSINLTSTNFLGISNGAYADGDSSLIQTGCSVNDAQSGLTAGQAYYVQTDGTLSETPDDPSVLAGTALSATKLLIKG